MNLSGLLPLAHEIPAYRRLLEIGDSGSNFQSPISSALHLPRGPRAFFTAALKRDVKRPVLVVTARVEQAQAFVSELAAWLGSEAAIARFAEPVPLPYERAPWGDATRRQRLMVLAQLLGADLSPTSDPQSPTPIVVTSARALMQKTLPRERFAAETRPLRPGQVIRLEHVLEDWVGLGYEAATVVEAPGQFSRRGGILDIYPPASAVPVRVELFGDEIESLRAFDPTTQRSRDTLGAVAITPAREVIARATPALAERLQSAGQSDGAPPPLQWSEDLEALATGTAFPAMEFYLPYLYRPAGSLLDYFPNDGLVVVDDWEELADCVRDLSEQADQLAAEHAATGDLPPDYPAPLFSWDELAPRLQQCGPIILGGTGGEPPESESAQLRDAFSPGPRFGGQIKPLLDHLTQLRAAQKRTVVVTRQAERLSDLWADRDVPLPPVETIATAPPRGSLTFVQGALTEGFTLPVLNLLTDAELFGWSRPEPRRRRPPRAIAPETFFADMRPGDYVVHIEHGVGRFGGLVKRIVEGTEREYLQVVYANSDTLYVPVHQADRLSRYIGADDRPPSLHRLGGAEWAQVKRRAQEAAEEVAEELLELYAAREASPGYAFSPDHPWQHELEAAFPYVETEDQMRAIQEIKADMEKPRPMDRLICGDVGYGKTEVALRAAFKAVMDHKQVAILVPTTVLAQQHFNTFQERLKPFPVVVEMLSRFRSRKEQADILEKLKNGQVDIVIGTHRLLQKDVVLKDLGLLIIDEEQRFGVTHKERLKQMRTEVDVLTMTATPIPRTLYMSLTGVRDVSLIETAPEERLPVVTHVGEYNDKLVRQAVLRELDRGGQVFFVHNRVQGIEQVKRRLDALIPDATISIAHGQMNEDKLERVMVDYTAGKIDVLLSTSIIESGLDIPNANTIIINHADWFGLAQLYQLRGRVGRGAVRAYGYFLYDKNAHLSLEARQRLETIATATELGAGYSIAMRDLEIRGAGDLLGTRQSGHIAAVGFDLYTRLLARAVQKLRAKQEGKPPPPPPPLLVTIDLPLPVYIPGDYVPDHNLRLQLYRRMAGLSTLEQIEAIAEELADRFGPIPDPVDNLLFQLRLKVLAAQARVESIAAVDGQLMLRAPELDETGRYALQRRLGNNVRVGKRQIWLPRDLPASDWQVRLVQVLEKLSA
jgi:transcription-repair coupling factor (superfamily II helicase)